MNYKFVYNLTKEQISSIQKKNVVKNLHFCLEKHS